MAARLKDVAAAAGVSVKTVSNVVHGYPGVTTELRARVERALQDLAYRPNLSARSLRTGRTGLVALAVPRLDVPYFAELARWVLAAAGDRGWTVLVEQTQGDPVREAYVVGHGRPRVLDGVIMSPLALDDRSLKERDVSIPLVLLGERVSPAAGADHVAVDNVAAGKMATEHLLSLGRRKVGIIGAQRDRRWTTAHLREQGFRQAMRDAGLPVAAGLIATVDSYRYEHGAVAAVRSSRPGNDRTRCSASTTHWRTEPCVPLPTCGCGCPTTWR